MNLQDKAANLRNLELQLGHAITIARLIGVDHIANIIRRAASETLTERQATEARITPTNQGRTKISKADAQAYGKPIDTSEHRR